MSELETKLRNLAARGEFTYLSVTSVSGKGVGGVVFQAQVSPASRFGHGEGRDVDPVKAILIAIDNLPKSFAKDAPKRARKEFGDPAAEPREPREPWDVIQ